MDRVNAQRLQCFDLSERPRRSQFDDVRGARPRQHQQRRHQRSQLAHDHRHHHRAGEILRPYARQQRHHLPDNDQSERAGQKAGHRQQPQSRPINLSARERMNDPRRSVELRESDAEGDQRECDQPFDRLHEMDDVPPDGIELPQPP